MLFLVALVCLYLGLWKLTATRGVNSVHHTVYGEGIELNDEEIESWVPAPMIVRLTEVHPVGISGVMAIRRYYMWYGLGAVHLPFRGYDPPMPEIGGLIDVAPDNGMRPTI